MIDPGAALGLLWITWITGWAGAAFFTKRTVRRQPTGSRVSYAAFQWIGTLLLLHPFGSTGIFHPLIPWHRVAAWIAVGAALAGFGFAVWARVHLGRNWSAVVTLKADHTLIRSGPYGITRHPIYTGLLLSVAATALLRGSMADALAFALFVVAFTIKARQEERLMSATFGDAYAAYCREVPMLVPNPLRKSS